MKKLQSMVLTLVLVLTYTITAFASPGATVPANVKPIATYTVMVGTTYRLPENMKQDGDTYLTSNSKLLTVEAGTGRFKAVSAGSAYIAISNGADTRYIQVNARVAAPAPAKTLEERINGLTLIPQPKPKEESASARWYDYSRVEKIRDDNTLTNYGKLKAVFLDISQQTKGLSCTSHTSILGAAYEMLGFKVYEVNGGVKARAGYSLEEQTGGRMGFGRPGYTPHTWLAVEIDGTPVITTKKSTGSSNGETLEYEYAALETGGEEIVLSDNVSLNGEILFFDVNLNSTHGMGFESCFAVPPQNTTLYIAIYVNTIF